MDYAAQMAAVSPVQAKGAVQLQEASTPTVTADDVTITVTASGNVSDHAKEVLKEIVAAIGETSATITSGTRTPEAQAQAMYDNCETYGAANQHELYGSNGDQVIDVYEARKEAGDSETEIVSAMTDKINELGPSNVSAHCSNNDVIDVSPGSIADDDAFATQAQAHASVTNYIGLDVDPVHHLEIE